MVIAPGVASLGRQSFVQPFPFCLWEPLGWEQLLVVNVEGKGLVIIMGCGHPSMERIIERELIALSPHDSSGGVLQVFEASFPKAYRYISIGSAIELP